MLLYPVNLNITKRLCVVVGGGDVALRKAKALLMANGLVRIISPELHPGLLELNQTGEIQWLERMYVEGDLQEAFLVFAATDNRSVQDRIMAEAEKCGALINSVDDPHASHFHVPASFRRGNMLVTVSTTGGSPALARRVRQQLEKIVGEEYEAVVYLLSLIRAEVVPLENDAFSHSDLFHRLLDLKLIELVKTKNWFELQMLLIDELPPEIDGIKILSQFIEVHGIVV